MSSINPGDAVRLTAVFTNLDDADTDPTTVTLHVRPKQGSEKTFVYGTDAAVVRDSAGRYHLDFTVPSIAPHRGMKFLYEWQGTGAVAVVGSGSFSVSDTYGA